jgi:hypothetical protein
MTERDVPLESKQDRHVGQIVAHAEILEIGGVPNFV